MIYILTGIAKSGKSYLVNQLKDISHFDIIQTDEIMMDVHKKNLNSKLDIHASDRSVANILKPFITKIITSKISDNKDTLIEGVHFNTDYARSLINQYPNKVRIIYIGYKDISVKDKVEELTRNKDNIENDWIFHHTDSVETIVSYMIEESKRIYNECKEHDLEYIDIYDINKQSRDVIDRLLKGANKNEKR